MASRSKCHGAEIVVNDKTGTEICSECGCVCGASKLANEVSFGKSGVQGSFVPAGASTSYYGHGVVSLADQQMAKTAKVHKLLQTLGGLLDLEQKYIDEAKRTYTIAQEKNFIQGRHSKLVAAASLYYICRLEKIPYLLIDIADHLKLPLYSLGACYLKLLRELHLSERLPEIDPSLYIHRFCSKLEFEDKEREVAMTSLRILQSFKRDWIANGRRPAGLCGAAIRIAAKFHGFNRTTKQIVSVVKVCENTVRRRIDEFKSTPASALTQGEFEEIDFDKEAEGAMNPPSFTKRKDLQMLAQLENEALEMEEELKKIAPPPSADDGPGGGPGDVRAEAAEGGMGEEEEKEKEEKEEEKEKDPDDLQLVRYNEQSKAVEEVKKSSGELVKWKSETLSDIEDAEVEPYLLSEKEVKLKTVIWEAINKEWIEKNEKKRAAPHRASVPKPPKRKKTEEAAEPAEPQPGNKLFDSLHVHTRTGEKAKQKLIPLLGADFFNQ